MVLADITVKDCSSLFLWYKYSYQRLIETATFNLEKYVREEDEKR
jgi:hypothetical protein